jgi:hypothetical protein
MFLQKVHSKFCGPQRQEFSPFEEFHFKQGSILQRFFTTINIIIMHGDWLTEWEMLRARPHFLLARATVHRFVHRCLYLIVHGATDWMRRLHATLSPSFSVSLSLSHTHSLSLSLTGEEGAHTLFTGQRLREREREGERERKLEKEREKAREKERERKTEGER